MIGVLRRRVMGGSGSAPLPYDAEIEYLESSGTQWIETNITPTTSTKAQLKLLCISNCPRVVFGYLGANDSSDWRIFNSSQKMYFDWGPGRLTGANGGFPYNTIYELELGNFYVKDLTTGTNIMSGATQSFSGESSIKLNYHTQTIASTRFYYVKVFNNNILVLDMIPVRVAQVGYMYDRVSGQLFGNSGSGDFVLGPDV